jgi:hypothetical protein
LVGVRRCTARWSRPGGGVDDSSGGVREGQSVGKVGVTVDIEAAEVMLSMATSTGPHEIPVVGRPLVFAVDDVVDVEVHGGVAPWHPAFALAEPAGGSDRGSP